MRERSPFVWKEWSFLRFTRSVNASRRKNLVKFMQPFLAVHKVFSQPLSFRRQQGNAERSKQLFYLDAI